MKLRTILAAALIAFHTAHAQTPLQLNYQGRVAVQGTNFTGTGQFKFALVDAGTPFGTQATASAFITGDAVTSINVTSSGAGYTTPPLVTIAGNGTGATATATLSLGIVSSITVTNGGSGYTAVTVAIAPPPAQTIHSTYWSNDNTSFGGEQPTAAVTLPVQNGLYSVGLGDTSLANMTALSPSLFSAVSDVRLRVWFNDGTHGFQQLTPDQRLRPAPWAFAAANAATATTATTVVDGAITTAKLAPGAVNGAALSTGAAAANLNASGQSGVASGGMVLSAAENPALAAAGYAKLPPVKFSDYWTEGSATNAPANIDFSNYVWTGTEFFVWAGGGVGGGRYNPTTNTWIFLAGTAPNAPAGNRNGASAVWTGTEVIVWGGSTEGPLTYHQDGGRYNPTTDTWTAIPSSMPNSPAPRNGHTAVWTGNRMIVWGGDNSVSPMLNTGGIFDPQANGGSGSWTPTALSAHTPIAREAHTAIWTGSQMLIWGGGDDIGDRTTDNVVHIFSLPVGNPNGEWLPNPAATITGFPPSPRYFHKAVWTGSEMIIWGGSAIGPAPNFVFTQFDDGARFNPATMAWSPMSSFGAEDTSFASMVWTGENLLLFGASLLEKGKVYRFGRDVWEPIASIPSYATRSAHRAVWTGSNMVIWGGHASSAPWIWTPERQMYLYQRP